MARLSTMASAVASQLESSDLNRNQNSLRHGQEILHADRSTAELLYAIATCSQRRHMLEVGTSSGYIAIWLASALRETRGAPLLTIDDSPLNVSQARSNLFNAALQDWAHVVEGDVTMLCEAFLGPFDCVFFHAARLSKRAQLELLIPKLTHDAILLTDNAISNASDIAQHMEYIEALQQFDTVLVPIGKGLHISRRRNLA